MVLKIVSSSLIQRSLRFPLLLDVYGTYGIHVQPHWNYNNDNNCYSKSTEFDIAFRSHGGEQTSPCRTRPNCLRLLWIIRCLHRTVSDISPEAFIPKICSRYSRDRLRFELRRWPGQRRSYQAKYQCEGWLQASSSIAGKLLISNLGSRHVDLLCSRGVYQSV